MYNLQVAQANGSFTNLPRDAQGTLALVEWTDDSHLQSIKHITFTSSVTYYLQQCSTAMAFILDCITTVHVLLEGRQKLYTPPPL